MKKQVTLDEVLGELKTNKKDDNVTKNRYLDKLIDSDDSISTGTINELPGGYKQTSQKLLTPIKYKKTKSKRVIVEDTLLGSNLPPLEAISPIRHCIDCNSVLPVTRYRHCAKCVKTLPADEGDAIYCGVEWKS